MPSPVSNRAVSRNRRLLATRTAAIPLCLFAGLAPAWAQSLPLFSPRYGEPPQPTAITVRLLAVAQPTVAFLARSSRLAENQASKRLRLFAQREARDQDATAEALAVSAAPTLVTGDPLDTAAVGAVAIDEGSETILSVLPRSLRTPGARAVAADRVIATAGQADLAQLASLEGRTFDVLYVATQEDGLRRLLALYRDYTQNGDDETLRAVTVHQLPRLRARLAELTHVDGRVRD